MAFQVRDYPWLPDPIERGLNWIGARGWLPIVAIGLAVLAFWGFLSIADEVSERETYQFDTRLLEAIGGRYETATGFWREAGRDITALGGSTVITLMVTGVIAFLLLRGHWKSTIFVLVSVLGGLALSLLLKEVYDRPRPEIFEHQSYTHTPSFPSGHSANSAVAYLTMAILLTKLVRRSLMKGYIFFVGLLIPFLVGVSRVYLGVHWPTDVAAGWLIGLGWGLVVWGVATFLQRRGGLEPEGIMDADRSGRRRVVQEA
jgi:undecaprenyl-diphosphatase